MPSFVIPPQPVPYPGNLAMLNAKTFKQPAEGPKTVPLSVLWSVDSGPNKSVSINLASQGPSVLFMSQIVTLYVDNLGCLAPVKFYFDDTQFELEVPALSFGFFPVITNGLKFVFFCPNANSTDATRVNILNYWVAPTVTSQFAFSEQFSTPGGGLSAGTNLTIIDRGAAELSLVGSSINGIIQSIHITATGLQLTNSQSPPANPFLLCSIFLRSPTTGDDYWQTNLSFDGFLDFAVLANLTDLAIPFIGGLDLRAVNQIAGTGVVTPNIYYRVTQ